MERISKELMGASSAPMVLSILEQGDSYGYEIIQKVKIFSNASRFIPREPSKLKSFPMGVLIGKRVVFILYLKDWKPWD